MSATLIVDDNDPSVQYNPAWALTKGPGYGRAYNLTLHRATEAGQSVNLVFRGKPSHPRFDGLLKPRVPPYPLNQTLLGSGIQVVTMRQPSVDGGYPVTSYEIDGTRFATVSTRFVPDGPSQANVTVFAKRDLVLGTHILNITNLNGTHPSSFWLDYFIVDISPTAIVGTTSSSSSSTASATAGASTAVLLSGRIPAIAGGVAGALLVLVAAILGCLWRRRRRRARREKMMRANIQPYVPVVRIISQYQASLHSLEKVPPSLAAGTQSPSVSTSDVRTPAEPEDPPARSGGHDRLRRPRAKPELGTGSGSTPSDAGFPGSPAPLLLAEPRHLAPPAETVPQSPAAGLVLPDELGRALSDAPPEVRSSVMSFMHTLFLQGGQRPFGGSGGAGEVDSGVRMYDEEYVPPPQYTTQ
ncbi:hypothetical protein C8T65DRAFT_670579 [Cerioporus squamosus]|nr:hypothetical protein C8T65DRAFT_670579 [Cerioporus squamosus]